MVALKRKNNTSKLLRKSSGALTTDPKCCCGPFVAINICNFNKWSDEIHDAVLNGNTLTRPTVHVDYDCGGGYYCNLSPLPDYCTLQTTGGTRFRCCGSQVSNGAYPAAGRANEDPPPGESNPQNCGTLGDCSGDLITQSYPSSYLVTGTNTLTVNRTGPNRSAGSYGVVEVARLHLIEGTWRIQTFLATGTYSSGNLTLTWNL